MLIASRMDKLQDLVNRLEESSLLFGLALNSSKTKVMKIGKNNQNAKGTDYIIIDNNEVLKM